jgi:hypothetical protein
MTHPVALAVAPLKAEAIARAEKDALARIERLYANLEAAGWNLDVVAPRPDSFRCGRVAYKTAIRLIAMYDAVTTWTQSSRSSRDPCIVKASPEKAARFVEQAKAMAAEQYDAFVAKLVGKIGDCDTASLEGSHVWGRSTLTVTKGAAVERWMTQQIVNVSVLGTLFNQWPSRKVK